MITVRVLFFATLRRASGGEREMSIQLPEGATVQTLLDAVVANHPGASVFLPSLLIARNKEYSERDARLSNGDEVALMPPMSGG